MHYRHKDIPMHFKKIERRKDLSTSDIVQVGLMFMKIFGREKGVHYFKNTILKPRNYRRIIAGIYRGTGPRQRDDPLEETIDL